VGNDVREDGAVGAAAVRAPRVVDKKKGPRQESISLEREADLAGGARCVWVGGVHLCGLDVHAEGAKLDPGRPHTGQPWLTNGGRDGDEEGIHKRQ
jgi:hypothetical protein